MDAVSASVGAVRTQLHSVCEQLQRAHADWWPVHEALLGFLDDLRLTAAELVAHARAIGSAGAAHALPALLTQLSGDVAWAATVLAARQAEASARLKACQNWAEAAELARFVGRCSRWVREARDMRL